MLGAEARNLFRFDLISPCNPRTPKRCLTLKRPEVRAPSMPRTVAVTLETYRTAHSG